LIVLDYYIRNLGKQLLGITCSNGNTNIEDVVRNVLIVQEICGSSYPVYVGIDYNLAGENLKDYFFGKDGLGLKQ
jgi:inosine-uridine nucleoside N-ribohydrolase